MTQFILREFSNQKNLPNKQKKSCKVQTVYVFHTPYTQCTKKEREKIKYLIECRWVKWLKVVKMKFFLKKKSASFHCKPHTHIRFRRWFYFMQLSGYLLKMIPWHFYDKAVYYFHFIFFVDSFCTWVDCMYITPHNDKLPAHAQINSRWQIANDMKNIFFFSFHFASFFFILDFVFFSNFFYIYAMFCAFVDGNGVWSVHVYVQCTLYDMFTIVVECETRVFIIVIIVVVELLFYVDVSLLFGSKNLITLCQKCIIWK